MCKVENFLYSQFWKVIRMPANILLTIDKLRLKY